MPKQNRVNPFGDLIATSARGSVMGNRGCLHDTADRPKRQYQTKRWIMCKLEFKGRHREPMPPNQYTSLFFLDEATALAAGHRPCCECNREKFNDFVRHWSAANPEHAGGSLATADSIDAQLHRERITDEYYQRDKRKRVYGENIAALPNWCFVAFGTELIPHLVYGAHIFPWSAEGYGLPRARPVDELVAVLTPRSTLRALEYGYQPQIHSQANLCSC